MRKACRNCGHSIDVMCFQGQDYCSENCRKDLEEKEKVSQEALDILRAKLTDYDKEHKRAETRV